MNLAILGTDGDTLRLVAAARQAGHGIVWLGDERPEDAAAISQWMPRLADRHSEWELLLDGNIVDGMLIGGGTTAAELRAEQLKRLVTEAVPLLIVHPAFDSVLPYYELDMARRETGCIVRHYNPLIGHPIVAELAEWVRSGHPQIGAIPQFTCERHVADASHRNVVRCLARDVELLASIGGDIRRVTAIGPTAGATSFASLQAQMTASSAASIRWSVRGAVKNESIELTLVGERGAITLAHDEKTSGELGFWRLTTTAAGESRQQPLAEFDSARQAIKAFADSFGSQTGNAMERSTWDTATRAMEVVDAVELSLEKGRTIDVYQQQLSERLAFRGTMAALGCGLLLIGFVAIVLVTLLGGAESDIGQKLIPSWAIALLAVFAGFLLLQFAPLLVRRRKNESPAPREAENHRG